MSELLILPALVHFNFFSKADDAGGDPNMPDIDTEDHRVDGFRSIMLTLASC